jgi:hypothetical protein
MSLGSRPVRLPLGGIFSPPSHDTLEPGDLLIPVIVPKVEHLDHKLANQLGVQPHHPAVIPKVLATEVRHRRPLTLSLCLYGVL